MVTFIHKENGISLTRLCTTIESINYLICEYYYKITNNGVDSGTKTSIR